MKWWISPIIALSESRVVFTISKYSELAVAKALSVVPIAPQRRILFQSGTIALSLLLISTLTPGAAIFSSYTAYSDDYIQSYSLPGDVLVADENGYLVKINPPTDASNRIGLTDYAVHTIESGESLSLVSARYGISVETIIWENNLSSNGLLRVGQKLLIPPVDGVSYKVKSGDTLKKLAEKYKISTEAIIAQNNLQAETIAKGQNLFLPGARPLIDTSLIALNYRTPAASRNVRVGSYVSLEASDEAPATGKIFIFPTRGKITQQFHAGHYALDIADRSKPAIWAAGDGIVIKASSGTWGGGYGNHIIIDHGNGVQTLYGHMDHLDVVVGQHVKQGEVLGQMGNTGHVYGVTGIHLHFEVRDHGVKKNPVYYY